MFNKKSLYGGNRRSIRLKEYDYSKAGLYFITICCQNGEHLLGKIVDEQVTLNEAGVMVENWYYEMENKFPDRKCGEMIIMPNHMHFIIENLPEGDHVGGPLRGHPQAGKIENRKYNSTIGDMMVWFKTMTTNEYIKMVKRGVLPPFDRRIWQRNYWDRIIRSEKELGKLLEYIRNNPLNWETDSLNA